MATIINVTIDCDGETITHEIDPERLPLMFLEGLEEMQQNRSYGKVRKGIKRMLKLTDEQSESLTVEHIGQIADAIQSAREIPNGRT